MLYKHAQQGADVIRYSDIDIYILGDNAKEVHDEFVKNNVTQEQMQHVSSIASTFVLRTSNIHGYTYNLIHGVKAYTAQDVISHFDFRCCSVAYDIQQEKLIHIGGALGDIMSKNLFINASAAAPSVGRLFKYISTKGFTCDAQQFNIFTELLLFHGVNNEKGYMEK
jgi:hypothetical protein